MLPFWLATARVHVRNLLLQVPGTMAPLKYFSRESPQPKPFGPLSDVVSPEAIMSANKEVKAVVQSTRAFHELDGGMQKPWTM